MRAATITAVLLGLFVAASAPADELPKLAIVSTALDAKGVARIYNREAAMFFARPAGRPGTRPLRGVSFLLYDEGGNPKRAEDVRFRVAAAGNWGAPPSNFALPLEDVEIPVGRYRLLATREGYRPAEVKLVFARFGYRRVEVAHDRTSYRVALSFRLDDGTEKKKRVTVTVRVRREDGTLLDEREVVLFATGSRSGRFETRKPLRLSSSRKRPDRELPVSARTGVLKLEPGSRLEVEIGSRTFAWPVPVPEGWVSRDPELSDEERKKNKDATKSSGRAHRRPQDKRGGGPEAGSRPK